MYWLTNTAVSSARLYWNTSQVSSAGFFDPRNVQIPVAVTVFPDEIYAAPQSWAKAAYPKLIYFSKLDKGGHFAAWEQPEVFSRRCARRSGRCADSEVRESPRPARRGGSRATYLRWTAPRLNVPAVDPLDATHARILS